MANTRKVLERIPDDKLDWKPHPKSNTIGWNANHVADILNWLVLALTKPSLDVAPPDGPKYRSQQIRIVNLMRPRPMAWNLRCGTSP